MGPWSWFLYELAEVFRPSPVEQLPIPPEMLKKTMKRAYITLLVVLVVLFIALIVVAIR